MAFQTSARHFSPATQVTQHLLRPTLSVIYPHHLQSPGPPLATSSPQRPGTSMKALPSKRNKLKIILANFQGMKTKREVIAEMLQSLNPDIVIGVESHLDSSVSSAEIFPPTYCSHVHRRDRVGKKGGGVFITSREDIDMTPLPELSSASSETAWAELQTHHGKVLIGAHYRPPNSPEDVLIDLDASIANVTNHHKKATIILGGDLNLPGIDWTNLSTVPGSSDVSHCRKLLDITLSHYLEQLVHEPTRGPNILDLCFTTNPSLVQRCTTGPGISDHDHIVIAETCLKARPNRKKPRKIQLFSKVN